MGTVNNTFCVHILVSGKVQGVAFRYYARNVAEELEIAGWIKNLNDGRVELMIEGTKLSLEKMIEWCTHGPDRAIVENIVVDWLPCIKKYSQFQIIS